MALFGLLWFLQGADILHIRPILCFADCEYIAGGSRVWEITEALSFILGIAVLIAAHSSYTNWNTRFRKTRG